MAKKKEKEIRSFSLEWRRSEDDPRRVEGVAAVFNSESEDLGFRELIADGAIDDECIQRSDVFAYLNHDDSRGVLARSRKGKGSLRLWLDGEGLHYSFSAPKTALGDELLEYLERGDITASSFAFTVGDDHWENRDGQVYRTITKIDRLYDVSPVFEPAYQATSVAQRKAEDLSEVIEALDKAQAEVDALFV